MRQFFALISHFSFHFCFTGFYVKSALKGCALVLFARRIFPPWLDIIRFYCKWQLPEIARDVGCPHIKDLPRLFDKL